MSAGLNLQLLRLSGLIDLQERARRADAAELDFLVVNETAAVVACQQAALWRAVPGRRPALVLSGVAVTEDGPYRAWLARLFPLLARTPATQPFAVDIAALPKSAVADWAEWFPPHALCCPLTGPDGAPVLLLLGRADPWGEGDTALAQALAGSYTQSLSLAGMARRRRRVRPRRAVLVLLGLLALGVLGALPVRESVLAPAEIVPIDPAPLRAPFDGVVDAVQVAPNAPVKAGQVLVTLDRTQLATREAVAGKALEMARAEYDAASQQAMNDQRAKSRLAVLQSRIEQQQAELAYSRDMLARAALTAPIDGIAVFDDANDWPGRPVALGERLMVVASPSAVQVEIQVPAGEVVTFENGAEVLFFGNIAPDQPIAARLTFSSYSSAVTPDGVLAYAFRARLDEGQPPQRLGLRGTAKIYGERRPLALWLLRRPLAALRQWLAL